MSEDRILSALSPGDRGVIKSVANSNPALRHRLIDMGLTPGTAIRVKKVAPFGDPVQVTVRGYELSLRKSDASEITLGESAPRCDRPRYSKTTYAPRAHDPEMLRRMRMAHEHELDFHHERYDATAHDKRDIKLALVGNPNCGKTTLFNALTGSDQYVGNWPGVTVEKKEGHATVEGKNVVIVDLPGIYSLSPYSMEEIVARDFIINEQPDAIINIVDATNLERNLYLTVQLLELERPMVLALNFMDEMGKKGDKIDCKLLSQRIGVPVIPISARSGDNLNELMHIAHRQIHMGFTLEPDDLYDEYTHEIHHRVHELIHDAAYAAGLPAHWCSIKLIEGDNLVKKALNLPPETNEKVEAIAAEYAASSTLGDRETLIADSRYAYIEKILHGTFTRTKTEDVTVSDKIDRVLTGKFLALPVFLLAMLIVFAITFGPFGSCLSNGVGIFIDNYLAVWTHNALTQLGAQSWLISLFVDGIIAGVGGVLTFLPQIALLFFFLSLMEDSGYMSRAAFIMDRLLKRFGLSGKAFIPMLMGFGCTVPAVMGARTMENEKDRRMTIMLVPFMSCSAKLPVYGMIAAAFFPKSAGLVVFSFYVLGMVMAVISGLILKRTAFKGDDAPFLLELPPYRLPTLSNVLRHVWEKVRGFLVKAGTLILVMSVVLWVMQSFDMSFNMVSDESKSILGSLGNAIAPIFKPMGFGTWQAAVALLTGLIAKEAVVASLSMFYGFSLTASSSVIASALSDTFHTSLAAYAFLVFILLYVPCVAAVAAIHKEMGSLKWTLASIGWQIGWAYVISFLVYNIGRLFVG
ncbi:MAG: ferrous iron transport protein B [Oscillospiraceae bacterium]